MALAITSLPVPVSPWIKTAESTGATLSTSVSRARNFGLDPIKSKVVIAFSFMNADRPRFPLIKPACASFHLFCLVIHSRTYGSQFSQRDAGRLALSEKTDAVLTGQCHVLEVENDAAILLFHGDERFQFGNAALCRSGRSG